MLIVGQKHMPARLAFWAAATMALLLTAGLATEATLWATGRAGPAPCGEDGWRWGLMKSMLTVPSVFMSFSVGLSLLVLLRLRTSFRLSRLAILVVCLQLVTASSVLVILSWPDVRYEPPTCE